MLGEGYRLASVSHMPSFDIVSEVDRQELRNAVDQAAREVATRLGVSTDALYAWVREQRKAPAVRQADNTLAVENRRLQAELKRVTEERDILKKAAAYFAKG